MFRELAAAVILSLLLYLSIKYYAVFLLMNMIGLAIYLSLDEKEESFDIDIELILVAGIAGIFEANIIRIFDWMGIWVAIVLNFLLIKKYFREI